MSATVEAAAPSFKDQGNDEFKKGNYLKAAAMYSKAIQQEPNNAVLYSNRSAALLKLKKVTKALEDADECIRLSPEWEKGYFRKAAIFEDQDNVEQALEYYQQAQKFNPDNKELVQKIRMLQKLQKKGPKDEDADQPAPEQPQPAAAAEGEEDLGSEEVAAFVTEYLQETAAEIFENGTDITPTVHFLPGPEAQAHPEDQEHIRGMGAFENPETWEGFMAFLRSGSANLNAQAVVAIVPKKQIGYPRVWQQGKWPAGDVDGVFFQLESVATGARLRKCWFIPVTNKTPGKTIHLSEDYGVLGTLLKV